jgi:hypothetical protein
MPNESRSAEINDAETRMLLLFFWSRSSIPTAPRQIRSSASGEYSYFLTVLVTKEVLYFIL